MEQRTSFQSYFAAGAIADLIGDHEGGSNVLDELLDAEKYVFTREELLKVCANFVDFVNFRFAPEGKHVPNDVELQAALHLASIDLSK